MLWFILFIWFLIGFGNMAFVLRYHIKTIKPSDIKALTVMFFLGIIGSVIILMESIDSMKPIKNPFYKKRDEE